ncbi:MAG TPA: biotin/lipoyl-binding protein, partial [Anaerolineales bacterium]|nr:biotin/lipoyl-binding protein [Anaerolineales bacterium]
MSSNGSGSTANKETSKRRLSPPVAWIIVIVIVAMIGGGVYYYIHSKQASAAAAASSQQSQLQTATARTGNIVLRASGTGTLVAAVESSLGFKTSGTLTTLNVQVGSQVKQGDLLAQL